MVYGRKPRRLEIVIWNSPGLIDPFKGIIGSEGGSVYVEPAVQRAVIEYEPFLLGRARLYYRSRDDCQTLHAIGQMMLRMVFMGFQFMPDTVYDHGTL